MIKWIRPSGSEIETTDDKANVQMAESLGWKRATKPAVQMVQKVTKKKATKKAD